MNNRVFYLASGGSLLFIGGSLFYRESSFYRQFSWRCEDWGHDGTEHETPPKPQEHATPSRELGAVHEAHCLRVVNYVHVQKGTGPDQPPYTHADLGPISGLCLFRMYMIYYSYCFHELVVRSS